jgi:DNA polymerase-3 subunit delta
MDYSALDKSLQRQVISPVYLFYGEELYIRDQILNRFKELIPVEVRDFNLDIVDARVTSVEAMLNMAVTLPFMAERRLVIVKNADYFKAKRKARKENTEGKDTADADMPEEAEKEEKTNNIDDSLLSYIGNPLVSTCLIFCANGIDRKRKVFKAIEKNGQIVDFAPLKGRELNDWIDKKARNLGRIIESAAMAKLITALGNNLQQLNIELEKLACYTMTEKITVEDVDNMVSKTVELSIFDLVDAVGERNYQKAIKMAREMVFLGEPVIKILFMVARQARLLLKAKGLQVTGLNDRDVAAKMQIHPFVAQKCIKQARNFTLPELKAAMEKTLNTDYDIKSGRQEPKLALELLIIALCESNVP